MTELEYQENLRLAQGGDADAQFRLGYYFDEERCEYAEAWTWYERAAAQGCAWAWYNLAIMIQNGEHHAPDSALAAQYYLRAAECGDPDGLVGYAEILEESAETEADWLKIIGIYQRCNRPSGWYELALLYNKGNEFIPIDHVKANRWYRRAADAGHAKAATNLAFNLHDAIGCRRDWRQAFLYWKFAAEQGDSLAFLHLGETYALGHGTRRNYTKAFFWFRRCWFDSGMAAAAGWLGEYYLRGRCVKRDLRKARLWLTRAAKLGDARSAWELGYRFVSGDGGWPRDDARGRSFLEQYLETEPEDCDALYWLARSYGRWWNRVMPIYRKLYERDRDPWSAYRIVKFYLDTRKWFSPEEFAELDEMLRVASRKGVPHAGKLLHSNRWRRYKETLMTSEELAAKYRRSLRWGDGYWRYVCDFHRRGGKHEFEIAGRYLASSHWLDVIVGANLISQLGCQDWGAPFAEEALDLLIDKMPTVQTDDERYCILVAVAWQRTERSRAFLVRYAADPNAELRFIVAWGLYGENREELNTLLKLAHDPEEEVWDWAVFNLISEDGELYPELQEGLTALAGHPDSLMRYQAIAALAARHASNAEALLRAELAKPLSTGYELDYLRDAAQYLGLTDCEI